MSDIETHYISKVDEKFDADVYRKALVNNVHEYTFGKIMASLGALTLLFNAGISVYVYNQIQEITKETVKEQVPTLISDSEEVVRDNLISLLKDSRDGDRLAIEQIKSKPKSIQLLKELIAPKKSEDSDELADLSQAVAREQAILAIDYAGKTKEPELLETLFEVLNAGKTPLEVRDKALQALLQYSADDSKTLERVLSIVQTDENSTESTGSLWIVKTLSTFDAGRSNREINAIMQQALLSDKLDTAKYAVIYFILNPNQWQEDSLNADYSKAEVALSDDNRDLVKLLIESSSANSEKEQQDEAREHLNQRISEAEGRSGGSSKDFNKVQLQEIQKYFALALLQSGNDNGLLDFYSSSSLPPNLYYYNPEAWLKQVHSLFPDSDQLFSSAPTGTEEEQDQFLNWYYNTPLQWNATSRVYEELSAQSSIEQLEENNLDPFLMWMESEYYDSQEWLDKVYPLFPDAKELFFETLTGTYEEQDQLWHWVQENREQLQWNDGQHQYRLPVINPQIRQGGV
ncbi:MAG: hypothetical protein Kow00121_39320 [Elainellaceae cyanobacterium]